MVATSLTPRAQRKRPKATSAARKQKAKRPPKAATTADKFELYEASVQDPDADVALIQRIFKKERTRKPTRLREDFCGTAKLCACWVRRQPERYAVGLDIDQPTLDVGLKRHIEPLGKDRERVQLLCRDVVHGTSERFDVIVAFNFSYYIFKSRKGLLEYFRAARESLVDDGAFFLDIHGGTETFAELEETTKHKGFTYVWDQQPYDAIGGYAMRYIHFRFPDGSEMHRAFSYDWRMWTLPEIGDMLKDAGFSRVDVYWEASDDKGRGNGVFRRVARADNEAAWIAYIVAWK